MIRSLRRKFILIAMASLIGTMLLLCAAIGIGNYHATTNRVDRAIFILHQNGGSFLPPDSHSDPTNFNFHIAALDRQTVVNTISQIIEAGTERGYVGYYRFGVFPDEDGGNTIVVLDCFLLLQSANNMLRISAAIFLICVLIVFVLLLFLSKRAIRPFVDNLERQRQFITDASHELKTPLAILSADMGLLEDTYGTDNWLESAKSQIARLDKLIKNLVELARTEEAVKEDTVACFSVSEIAQANADAFLPLAEGDGKSLTAEIAAGIRTKGVQDNFFRLFAILLDNAVKYCDPGGTIRFTVYQRGRTAYITVSNPCAGLDPSLLPRYFDRFYRADSSRTRETGGYGIGLSTAKAIVTRHRGHITSRYSGGVITFTAAMPAAPAGT